MPTLTMTLMDPARADPRAPRMYIQLCTVYSIDPFSYKKARRGCPDQQADAPSAWGDSQTVHIRSRIG